MVSLPDSPEPLPESVLARLHPIEAAFARTLEGYRAVSFTGGRLALHAALRQAGAPSNVPCLPNQRGAPVLPEGWTGSISHKRTRAVAMVARHFGRTLGVDLETMMPDRYHLAPRILTPQEAEDIALLPASRRWSATLLHFSIKEAIYKALDPFVHRYVGFHEVALTLQPEGTGTARFQLAHNDGSFRTQIHYTWLDDHVLTSARIERSP